MFWNRSSAPPSRQIRSVPPSPEEHRSAAETLSELLLIYAKFAFDTEYLSARDTQLRCAEWAADSLISAPGRQTKPPAGSVELRTNWPGLVKFITEHRQAECISITTGRSDLGDSIRGFARIFHEMLQVDRNTDTHTARVLLRISNGLSADDDTQILDAAAELVELVQKQCLEREQLGARRLGVLQAHVAKLERALEGNQSPLSLDPGTRLHNAQAFAEHLEFISCVGKLFPCPPSLTLYRMGSKFMPTGSAPEDRAVRLADGLVRVLFSSEHYVARPGPGQFAAVLAGLTVDEALLLSEQARRSALEAAELPELALTGVVCSLVPGESSQEWEARAQARLNENGAAGGCLRCDIPASFCDESPTD